MTILSCTFNFFAMIFCNKLNYPHFFVAGPFGDVLHRSSSGISSHILPEEAKISGYIRNSVESYQPTQTSSGHRIHHDHIKDTIRINIRRRKRRVSVSELSLTTHSGRICKSPPALMSRINADCGQTVPEQSDLYDQTLTRLLSRISCVQA